MQEVALGVLSLSVHCFQQMDAHQNVKISIMVLTSVNWGHDPKQMPYYRQRANFSFSSSSELIELKAETDLQGGVIKTNRGEGQNSWYLDNKVMLAIFFLIQYLYIRHFK